MKKISGLLVLSVSFLLSGLSLSQVQGAISELNNQVVVSNDSTNDYPYYGGGDEDANSSEKSVSNEGPSDRLCVFPNPSTGTFRVNTNPGDKYTQITLYSSNGEQIWQKEMESSQVPQTEYTLPATSGYYLVEIKNSKRTINLTIYRKK
jgi:hypothetical protein